MYSKVMRYAASMGLVLGSLGAPAPAVAQDAALVQELSAYFTTALNDSVAEGQDTFERMREEVVPQVAAVFAEYVVEAYPEMVALYQGNAARSLIAPGDRFDTFINALFEPDVLRDLTKQLPRGLALEFGEDVLTSIVQAVLVDLTADAFGEIYGEQAGAYFAIVGEGSLEIIEATLLKGGTAGLIVYNVELWYGNARDFATLGRELQRMEDAGVDFQSVLIETEMWRQTYVQSLATGIYSGPMAGDHAGLVITPRWRAVMEDILTQMPENIRVIEDANRQLNRVATAAKGWAAFLDGIGATAAQVMAVMPETTPLDAADGTGAFPADLNVETVAPGGFLGFGPEDLPPPTVAWQQTQQPVLVRAGQTDLDVAVGADGQTSWRGIPVFPPALDPLVTPVVVRVSPAQTHAVLVQLHEDWGGERAVVVDLITGEVIHPGIVPEDRLRGRPGVGAAMMVMGPVMWSPDGRYVAFALAAGQGRGALGVVDLQSGGLLQFAPEEVQPDHWVYPDLVTLVTQGDGTESIEYLEITASDGTTEQGAVVGRITGLHNLGVLMQSLASYGTAPVFPYVQTGDWGPGVVIPAGFEVPYGDCLSGPVESCLRGHGLEGEALAFTLRTAEMSGDVYATLFEELGAVDMVTANVSYAPYERQFLVNGGLDVMVPSVGFDAGQTYGDDTSQGMLRQFPQATPIYTSISGHRVLPDGTQRFVIAQTVFDQCRACPILGSGFAFADIGPATGGALRIRPIGLFLEGPEDGSRLSVASLQSNPAYLQVRLNALGYDAGPMDGYPGPQTRAALMTFQAEQCLPETGQPDAATLAAMVAADTLRAPCAGAVIGGRRDAISPLAGGVYMSDPAFCHAPNIAYDQILTVQRVVGEASFMAGWEDPCYTRRTDIRQGMTRFRGTCYTGNRTDDSEWMLDIQSPEQFRVVTSPWGYQPGQIFTQCARDSVQGQNWQGAYAPLPMGLPIPEGMYAVSAQTCNLTDIDLGDRWGEAFTALEDGRFVIGYEVTCDVRDVTQSGARLTFDLACNAEGELYDRVEVVDVTGAAQMEWRGQSYVHCPGR